MNYDLKNHKRYNFDIKWAEKEEEINFIKKGSEF
jgi:hypothetical protein